MEFLASFTKILTTTGLVASGLIAAFGGALWLVDSFWVGQPALEDWD